MNKRPCRNKANFSAYEAFFGKVMKNSPRQLLDKKLLDECETEYGIKAALELVTTAGTTPSDQEVIDAIREADMKFVREENELVSTPTELNVEVQTNPVQMIDTAVEGEPPVPTTAMPPPALNVEVPTTAAPTQTGATAVNAQADAVPTTAMPSPAGTTNISTPKNHEEEHKDTAPPAMAATATTTTKPTSTHANEDVIPSDDDSDISFGSRVCEETITAGDVIEYWDPSIYTVGDPRGHGTATVIRVDTADEEYKLILSNSALLPIYTRVRRLRTLGKDGLVDVEPPEGTLTKPISSFVLEEGGSGTAADGIMKQAGRISDMHNRNVELVAAAARADGSGFAPMDVMVAMNGGTSRVAADITTVAATAADADAVEEGCDATNNDLTPERSSIRVAILASKRKQAEQVNSRRMKLTKLTLEKGDICHVKVEGNTRAATDFDKVPVVVVDTLTSQTTSHTTYKVASRDGYLKGRYPREQLVLHPHVTAILMGIELEKDDFRRDLTVTTASALFNVGGGAQPCGCVKTDCRTGARCSCKDRKQLCTTKCHKGRGNNSKCTMMWAPPPGSSETCSLVTT